jgi:hypothetical protein
MSAPTTVADAQRDDPALTPADLISAYEQGRVPPTSALVEVGDDHRLADSEPLRKLEACEGTTGGPAP